MKVKDFFWNWITKNILLAIVLVVGLVFGAYFLLKVVTLHGKELTVPDFTGMSVDEATALAAGAGMRVEVTDSVYVKRMERGTVYRHNPASGSKVKKGRRILLTINAVNPKSVTMPNLIGYSMRQAKAELSSRGLNLGKLIYVRDMATNNVLKQFYRDKEIEPGTVIASEAVIDLVVGLNATDNMTYVPYLPGVRYMAAVDVVHNSSLNVRSIVFDETVKDYADSLNAFVYMQVPDTSSFSLPMGTEMTLYLTLDEEKLPKEEPDSLAAEGIFENIDSVKVK